MKLVLLSHCRNEADSLLPYWIRHNLKVFDHAIIIDYHSTDHSREMIKDMAPDWEVVPAQTEYFGAVETDRHIMDLERQVHARFGPNTWKIALNVTEFLVHHDIKGLLGELPRDEAKAMGVVMVDHPSERYDGLVTPDLYSQKFFGRYDLHHGRKIHRTECGRYSVGRHTWADEGYTPLLEELLLLWFGWCPIELVRERKLAIQTMIPPFDLKRGFGYHHVLTPELLEHRYMNEEVPKCYWLSQIDQYLTLMQKFHDKFGLEMQLPEVETINA